ncbi:hypothetical protein [Paenibacillus ginsengarvi]|uniref:Class I SAM-dependent methyltransferase n=1 Tax=Paenibacillus ginsengarvi TaxID=400777 RepID=A0A3B0CLF1_9BACL|nr:hypothetical protein [Paenibacillus ginsengarvi]RKN85354.1 hypothetical protein D7M11_09740 [Paenibacillus ginsengarvi]
MLVRDIEKGLGGADQISWNYGPPLDNGALVHLCRHIEPGDAPLSVLELGGGRSTFMWQAMQELGLLSVNVRVLLHDPAAADDLANRTGESGVVHVHQAGLKQITDDEWESVFAGGVSAPDIWPELGTSVPREQYYHYTIRNTFYDQVDLPLARHSVDVLIADGPHGNGRSLAYPLFGALLKPDALVLVDDFDHYPFLADLGRLFRYRELYRDIAGDKRWALVKLQGMVQGREP